MIDYLANILKTHQECHIVLKTIQNEMIATVGNFITDNLSCKVRESHYFSILADDAADVSNKENLSVVITYTDATRTIREEFIGF